MHQSPVEQLDLSLRAQPLLHGQSFHHVFSYVPTTLHGVAFACPGILYAFRV